MRRAVISILVWIAIANVANAEPEQARVLFLEAQMTNCTLTLSLNNKWTQHAKFNSYLTRIPFDVVRNGDNQIDVTTTSVSSSSSLPARWTVTIVWLTPQSGQADKRVVVRAFTDDQPVVGTTRHVTFGLDNVPLVPSTTREPIGVLQPEDRNAIASLVRALHAAYMARDADTVFDIDKEARQDQMMRYGRTDAAAALEKQKQDLAEILKLPSFQLKDLPSDLTLVVENVLVKVTANNPLIQGTYEQDAVHGAVQISTLYFAHTSMGWQLVRMES